MSTTVVSKLIVAASLLVSPLAASATSTSAAQPAPANAKAAAAEKKICRQLPSSSSRLPQRVCLTEKEWKQVDADTQ